MLSRGASDASSRLRRTKSSASVNRRRNEPLVKDTIDPETARRHAMTAAHIAMDRANERASAEMRRSAELSRKHSNASRTGTGATPRSQNIRFCDVAETRQQPSTLQSKTTPAASSVYIPGSNSYSQLSKGGNGLPLNEFGVADGYGSTPSSYRRLRKTKSMLTPRKHGPSATDLASQSPGTPRTLRNVKSSLGDHDRLRLGLKRSMSFLKLSSGNLSKTFKRSHSISDHNDAAVERAREQFMQDVEQQRLQKKSSFLSAPKLRQQKAFRKTVRSDRTTEYGDGVRSEEQQTKQESKFRSFSASLRDKVRRVLRRSSSRDSNLPAQQMDASRAHFRDYLDGTDSNLSHEEYMIPHPHATSRGSFYVPCSQNEEPVEDLEAMSRSLRSMHSSESLRSNGRSRVTSWTNSTINNSLPGRITPLERKRLSIIQEHGGPHQPSSSIGRHMDEVSATHLPLSARPGNGQATTPIDSQRVYSALMKRIDQEQEAQDRAKTPKVGSRQDTKQIYPSSAQSFQTAPTIRQVASEESIHTFAPDEQHHQSSLHAPSWHEARNKTPQQIALENETAEKRKSRVAVPEAQSSFFPFSSETKPHTPSPFKLALAARRERQTSSEAESGSVIINWPSQADNGFETSSESQYSRTTSGQLPLAGMNRSDPELGDEPAGMATIAPARVNRYPRPTQSVAQLHKTESNASMQWKSWMNHQMTSLDRRNSRSSNAHYREGAQIDGDDTAVGGGRPSSSAGHGRRPSSARTTKGNETLTHQRRSSIINERFPLLELKEVPRNNTPEPRRSSVVTRLANSAAADLKRASLAAVGHGVSDENTRISCTGTGGSHPLRTKYSQMSFRGGEEPVSTPGRLQHQNHNQKPGGKRLGRPQSSMTIRSQYGRITETSGDGDEADEVHHHDGPRTTSRLTRPFDDHGYSAGAGAASGMGGSRASLSSHCYLRDENEYHRDGETALPRITASGSGLGSRWAENLKRSRGHQKDNVGNGNGKGVGMQISSKRMVSNFLRSRRRGDGNGNADAGGGKGDGERERTEGNESVSPAFV